MIAITGTVQNGMVVLDRPRALPEGSRVVVHPAEGIDGAEDKRPYAPNADKIMVQEGSVTGLLQKLSVDARGEFMLLPPVPGYAITCHFPESMLPQALKAIEQNVTVHGAMHYYADQPFPTLVHATSLEIHPRDEDLPTLAALRGLAPGSTGDLSAVDFVRSLRHD